MKGIPDHIANWTGVVLALFSLYMLIFRIESGAGAILWFSLLYLGTIFIGGIPDFPDLKKILGIPFPILLVVMGIFVVYWKTAGLEGFFDDIFGWAVGFAIISTIANYGARLLKD